MALTEVQQGYAEQAMALVPMCLRDFHRKFPCLRPVAEVADLEGAALLAITKAAATYDPDRAGISAYFSVAIKNACLRECEREIRSGSHSIFRISMEAAEQRQPVEHHPLTEPLLRAIQELPEAERKVIEEIASGTSVRAFAREWKVSSRQAKKRVMLHLDRLADLWREAAHR